jgi:tetratricopeptide (TPR) repeat protein
LQETLDRAESLISRGRSEEAIDLLEPLAVSHSRVADLHYYLGYAHVTSGDIWGGLTEYERAMELSRDPGLWLPLASLYLELELRAHALHAFRQVLNQGPTRAFTKDVHAVVESLERDVSQTAENLGLPVSQVETGLRLLEEGQLALHDNDFPACIAVNRRAIKLLAHWPPPRNNLSLALFFDGQPQEAIRVARQVLSRHPGNLQALSNAIRFLAWTGQVAEAQILWTQLSEITPPSESDRLKIAEAAAVIEDDEAVYRLLKPMDRSRESQERARQPSWQMQLWLAVAEANTGRPQARRRLQALQKDLPWAGDLLAALKGGQPGPGWSNRFPYFHSSELLPRRRVDELVALLSRGDDIPDRKFRRQMERFADRFPQVVLMAEKMIWEDNQPEAGVGTLTRIATPAAYAALRRFGLSRAGADEVRMQALIGLLQAGEITQDETLRVWSGEKWREVQLREYEISDEFESEYAPEVANLINQAMIAFQREQLDKAERLFRRVIKLDPRAKEAYNNLGTIHARREEHERAKEMFQKALEVDPTYVFPCCNLAMYLVDEEDIEGAQAILTPLTDRPRLRPQEVAFISYTQARIFLHQEDYEGARQALELALEVSPDHGPAREMLDWLNENIGLFRGFDAFFEKQRQRDEAKRVRLQTKLATTDPSLSKALSILTKGGLTGMAREVLPWGGWSALRKAELLQRIVEALSDAYHVERIVADLSDEEQRALRCLLSQGGHMPWQDFDIEYGNDLEESPYWEYHEPETVMGRLRLRGLLVEAKIDDALFITIPTELRPLLTKILD